MTEMNPLKNKNNHSVRVLIILAAILLLQCLMLVYWQGQRGNFYIDELYSFGYASSFTADSSCYITDSSEWKYDEWMDSNEITGQLRVDESESLHAQPLLRQLYLLANKRVYIGALNYIMSDIGEDATFYRYAWSVLALNIVIFIIAELLLAYCIRKITGSEEIMILSIIMFGFCGIIMGMCEFVRYYMLAIALLLAVITIHLKLWEEENNLRFLVLELAGFICAYYGLIHSEFIFVTCGLFFSLFLLRLLFKKKWLQSAIYAAPLLIGVLYFVNRRTRLVRATLHPEEYAKPTHGIPGAVYNYLTWTPERGWETLKQILLVLREKWFGSDLVMAAFIILLLVGFVRMLSDRRKHGEQKNEKNKYTAFIIMLLITAIISILFNDLANLWLDRYQSYIITLLIIVLWFCISEIRNALNSSYFLIAAAVLTIACAVVSQQPAKMPYLCIDEYASKTALEEYSQYDYVLFTTHDYRHPSYDSILHSGKDTRILACDVENDLLMKNLKDIPEEFVAWNVRALGQDKMVQILDGIGYNYKLIGSTHENDVYLCTEK